MRLHRLILVVLVGCLVVASGAVRSSHVIAAGQVSTAAACTPAPTGIPANAGNKPNGPLAIEVFALRLPANACHPNAAFGQNQCAGPTGDTLPPGPTGQFGIGVFDTGSSLVLVNNAVAGPPAVSDTTHLEVCKPATPGETSNCTAPASGHDPNLPLSLDVRIWGLAAVTANNTILTNPQAETFGLQIRPSPTNAFIPTLIGAPIAANTIAQIDYSRIITHDFGFPPPLTAPDITFYLPGDPAIPSMPYSFTLDRDGFVGTSPVDGADV